MAAKSKNIPKLTRRQANRAAVDNRRLVYSQARYFRGLRILTYDDLIGVGSIALIKAARHWPGKGTFSTYAVTAIRNAMLREIKRQKFLGQEPEDNVQWGTWHSQCDSRWLHNIPDYRGLGAWTIDLSQLSRRERKVVTLLWGLDGEPTPIGKVATMLGVPMPKVKEIADQALFVLRCAIASNE